MVVQKDAVQLKSTFFLRKLECNAERAIATSFAAVEHARSDGARHTKILHRLLRVLLLEFLG